ITLAITFHGVDVNNGEGCDSTLSHTATVALTTGWIAVMVIVYVMCFVLESRPILARRWQPLLVLGGLLAAGLLYMAALPRVTGIELDPVVGGLSRSVLLIPTGLAVLAYGLFLVVKSRDRGLVAYALGGIPVALLAGLTVLIAGVLPAVVDRTC